MKRRLLLGAGISGMVSLAGCVGSLEDITNEVGADGGNDSDHQEPLNEVHEQILSYEADTESVPYSMEMESGLTSCGSGRRVFSPPGEEPDTKEEKQEFHRPHCAESAEEEGIELREIDSSGFRGTFSAFGVVVTSPETGNEIEEAHFSEAQIELIQAANFTEDTLIFFQARTSQTGLDLQIERIGELPDENASFVSGIIGIGDADDADFLNVVIHVEDYTLPDDLLIGLEEYDGDPLPDDIKEEFIVGHAIWGS